jgi:U6 snRNA-associated Sm-like protein LSm3
LGEVEETIYLVDDEDDEQTTDNIKTVKKQSEMLFVRGTLDICLDDAPF